MMTLWWAPNKTERMPFSVIMSWLRVMCTWLRWRKSPSWKKRSLGFHFGLGVTLIHHMVPSKDILPSNLTLWGRPRRRKRRNSSSFLLFLSIILSFLSLFWKPPPREKWIIGAAFLTSVWFLKRRKHSATSSQNLQSKPPVNKLRPSYWKKVEDPEEAQTKTLMKDYACQSKHTRELKNAGEIEKERMNECINLLKNATVSFRLPITSGWNTVCSIRSHFRHFGTCQFLLIHYQIWWIFLESPLETPESNCCFNEVLLHISLFIIDWSNQYAVNGCCGFIDDD